METWVSTFTFSNSFLHKELEVQKSKNIMKILHNILTGGNTNAT